MTKGRPHLCLVPTSEPPCLFREPEWDASAFPAWVLPGRARTSIKLQGAQQPEAPDWKRARPGSMDLGMRKMP